MSTGSSTVGAFTGASIGSSKDVSTCASNLRGVQKNLSFLSQNYTERLTSLSPLTPNPGSLASNRVVFE